MSFLLSIAKVWASKCKSQTDLQSENKDCVVLKSILIFLCQTKEVFGV